MSIEEFGESLLSDVRRRRDDLEEEQRKRIRRQEKRAKRDLLKLKGVEFLIDIGNDVVRNRTNDFLTNEANIRNSTLLLRAEKFTANTLNRQKNLEASNLTGEQYFANTVLDQVTNEINAKYGPEYSTADKENAAAAVALARGKDLFEAHKKSYSAAEKLAVGDISYADYVKELQNNQPKNMIGAIRNKLAGIFSDGEDPSTSSARVAGMIKLAEEVGKDTAPKIEGVTSVSEDTYFNLFSKLKGNGAATLDILEELQDNNPEAFAIGKATPKIDFSNVIKVKDYDPLTGEEREISIVDTIVNGVNQGTPVNLATGEKFTGIDGNKEAQSNVLKYTRIPQETINALITTVNEIEVSNASKSIFRKIVEDLDGKNPDDERMKGTRARVYGPILAHTRELMVQYDIPDRLALQIATRAQLLNYEHIIAKTEVFGLNDPIDYSNSLIPNAENNPLLTLAAIEDLEKNQEFLMNAGTIDGTSKIGIIKQVILGRTPTYYDELTVKQKNQLKEFLSDYDFAKDYTF